MKLKLIALAVRGTFAWQERPYVHSAIYLAYGAVASRLNGVGGN